MATTEIVDNSAARLRAIREERQLTREELASSAQISVSTLRNLEVRGVQPTRGTRLLLAAALDLDVAEIWPDPRLGEA
jgi:transcriptional regulator with XRE-family HTH domain